jgi:hypothetical protein
MAAFFEKKTGSSWQPGIMICLEPETAGFVRLSPATQTTYHDAISLRPVVNVG